MPKNPSKKSVVPQPAPAPLSLRRAKVRFRFDDRPITGESVWVFAPSSGVLQEDVGLYGAPCATLDGYLFIPGTADAPHSVVASSIHKVEGRLIELTMTELHRLDSVAEHGGLPVHRFLAEVRTTYAGHTFHAWVYQHTAHATAREEALSASSQPASRPAPSVSV